MKTLDTVIEFIEARKVKIEEMKAEIEKLEGEIQANRIKVKEVQDQYNKNFDGDLLAVITETDADNIKKWSSINAIKKAIEYVPVTTCDTEKAAEELAAEIKASMVYDLEKEVVAAQDAYFSKLNDLAVKMEKIAALKKKLRACKDYLDTDTYYELIGIFSKEKIGLNVDPISECVSRNRALEEEKLYKNVSYLRDVIVNNQ